MATRAPARPHGRHLLAPGAQLVGPAVIEERESTTVLPPGCAAHLDEHGSLLVEVPGAVTGAR